MNWRSVFIYLSNFIAVFVMEIAIDLACGPEKDPYDYYVSFYHYKKSSNSGYRPFYFTLGTMFYREEDPQDEFQFNAREWCSYLGKSVRSKDIMMVMYNLDKNADSLLILHYQKGIFKIPNNLKHNTFLRALSLSKGKSAREYYMFAKRLEPIANEYYHGRWDAQPRNIKVLLKEAAKALAAGESEHTQFLKLRYYYQAQRLYFDGDDKQKSVSVYNKFISNIKSASHVKSWALSLKAGAEDAFGDRNKAACLFLEVFDHCPERRVAAYTDFKYTGATPADVYRFSHSNHLRALAYALVGLNTSQIGLQYLEKVYKYDPKSPMVDLLLTREINKLEEAYQSNKINKKLGYYAGAYSEYLNFNESNTTTRQFSAYIPKLKEFCSRLSAEKRSIEPALGDVTIAYLDWMQNKHEDGLSSLSEINDEGLSTKLYDQKQMVKLLLLTQKTKTLDTLTEAELLPTLKWLRLKVNKEMETTSEPINGRFTDYVDYHYRKYAASARDFYQKILSPMYLRQKDTTKAALAMLEGTTETLPKLMKYHYYGIKYPILDFWQEYLHSSNLTRLVGLKERTPKDQYLYFLTAKLQNISTSDLTRLLGTAYLREHDYANAFGCFSKCKNHNRSKTAESDNDIPEVGDPFSDRLCDFPKQYYKGKQPLVFYQLNFSRTMYKLQRKIIIDKKNAAVYGAKF